MTVPFPRIEVLIMQKKPKCTFFFRSEEVTFLRKLLNGSLIWCCYRQVVVSSGFTVLPFNTAFSCWHLKSKFAIRVSNFGERRKMLIRQNCVMIIQDKKVFSAFTRVQQRRLVYLFSLDKDQLVLYVHRDKRKKQSVLLTISS